MVYQQKPWLKLYDPKVGENVTVDYHSLFNLLEQAAITYSDKPALTFYGKSWSFLSVKEVAEGFAASLHSNGFQKGDRLAIMLPNSPHYIFSLFGGFKLGGINVQVNPMYVEREIEHVLTDSATEYMVVLDTLYQKVKHVQPKTALKKIVVVSLGGERLQLEEGDCYFEDFLTEGVVVPEIPIDRDEDVAMLQYTSGTTGLSKGVMLTHSNLLSNVVQVCDFVYRPMDDQIPEDFKIISVLPMFHVFGLSCNAIAGIREGANQLVLPRFDPKELMEIVKREKPFQMSAVPTMYFALNSQPDLEEYGFGNINYMSSGGAPLPVEQAKAFEQRTGGKLLDGYGQSELSPSPIFTPPFLKSRAGSVGVPIPGTEVRLVEVKEDGTMVDVPVGEAGELIVKGPQVMKGYWNRPEDTEKTIKDGWLLTGDIARMDEDGYFYILDRKKDMIIASGYNVYPREIEDVLYQNNAIEEVIVIGVPDEYRGETVKAFIKVKQGYTLTVEEIISYAKENLAPYKVPKQVEILDDLPKSSVGKLLRRVLRDQEIQKIGV
ncbi:long-chain fatty acid--CoA ligase [Mesobacillus maritimus]|uniref:long-chain-fatty-acid--CoA ligase n=1 Tax=Mesobacillus maritimus TaxID=1643336 RepID=UPI00203E9E70|nr:long-chain fatty acid--CoA ligase [Mesobacillus maritimus]MCM3585596.1 long-chain fatty acid--CoA ligase [Mesobacillus maritimus]MCM3669068.1 long-chain fatty acid--CoA ligase [Mesobacillus maritimus]